MRKRDGENKEREIAEKKKHVKVRKSERKIELSFIDIDVRKCTREEKERIEKMVRCKIFSHWRTLPRLMPEPRSLIDKKTK